MRHGLTLGELGRWFIARGRLNLDYRVVPMLGWGAQRGTGLGLAPGERTWINPSPNAANLFMARAYAGTVMLEGTTLSEGRGTTRPWNFRSPDVDAPGAGLRDVTPRTGLAGGLPPAGVLVRAHFS